MVSEAADPGPGLKPQPPPPSPNLPPLYPVLACDDQLPTLLPQISLPTGLVQTNGRRAPAHLILPLPTAEGKQIQGTKAQAAPSQALAFSGLFLLEIGGGKPAVGSGYKVT